MTNYKIVVAYDGTDYHGWQQQSGATTIAGTLQKAFEVVFFKQIKILGASRTDAGVHALGQVAVVQSPIDVEPDVMCQAWSKAIPSDIVIKKIYKLDSLIHPHDGVVQKVYAYYFFLERPMPFHSRFGWFIYKPVNLEILQEALNIFVGTHDFRSFCTGDDLVDTVRTIDSITVSYCTSLSGYKIELRGKSFLRYMVRRIVGACLAIAQSNKLKINDLRRILEQRNPEHTLPNAPAKGLILKQILYEKEGAYYEY